jgi:hypothetical protein
MLACKLDKRLKHFNEEASKKLNPCYPDISDKWRKFCKDKTKERPLVGAIREEDSAPTENAGVVLVVGINFGQFNTSQDYIGKSSACISHNGEYANKVATCLKSANLSIDKFHIVLANFSPDLTPFTWQNYATTNIREGRLIFHHGYHDPIGYISELIDRLSPNLCAVIFHGVGSCVHILTQQLLFKKTLSMPALAAQNIGQPGLRFIERLNP